MDPTNNRMVAAGHLERRLQLSHEVMNEAFYAGTLLVRRLSGTLDRLPITVPGRLFTDDINSPENLLLFRGQLRSYNRVDNGTSHLMFTLFVQHASIGAENDTLNSVELIGALCRPPIYRSTPFGREICDLMLAVHRAYGRSDYIPCIAWGRSAQYASRLQVGDHLHVVGRLQSREYEKLLENGEYIMRNAYEVSCFTLESAATTP